jgi:hypothetical protein
MLLLTLSLLSTIGLTQAGGWTSGGGDQFTDHHNPWFLGDRPIEYCIEYAEGFPISRSDVQKYITEGLAEWKKTLKSYKVDTYKIEFEDQKFRSMTLDSVYKEVCDDPEHQIVFKVGVVDEVVKDLLKDRPRTAIGYAFRKNYDHETFRSGGNIWFAPKGWVKNYGHPIREIKEFPLYNHPTQFKHLVLHELAHIFGVPLNDQWGSPLSKDIFTRIGQAQIHWADTKSLYLDPKIEDGRRRLAPLYTDFQSGDSFLLPTWPGNRGSNNDSPFAQLLNDLGLDNPSKDFKMLYYQMNNQRISDKAKLIITTVNGESHTLYPEKIIDHYGPRMTWNIHQGIVFYSPKLKKRDPLSSQERRILSTGAKNGRYKYIFKVKGNRYLVIVEIDESTTAKFYPLSDKYNLPVGPWD